MDSVHGMLPNRKKAGLARNNSGISQSYAKNKLISTFAFNTSNVFGWAIVASPSPVMTSVEKLGEIIAKFNFKLIRPLASRLAVSLTNPAMQQIQQFSWKINAH